ncbi:MAG: pyridoxamine 5'-phosphate oxidase family protein [Terriglobales bacterium]
MTSLSDSLVKQLLQGRYIASFASHPPDGSIHVVAVWYLFDGASVYVATSSRSRKARNAHSNPHVSLMIDARDADKSRGTNIAGTARILTGEASQQWNGRLHRKYLSEAALADPRVGAVFAAMDDVTIQITPVSVISWDMREVDRQFLGGAIASNPAYLLALER